MNKTANTGRYLQRILIGLSLLFALVTVIEMRLNYDLATVGESASQLADENRRTPAETGAVSVKPLDEYDLIIERPLFMPDRRPYVAEEVTETRQGNRSGNTAARIARDDYRLSAVIITDNKQIALLQSKKNNKLQKLNRGDELDGWILIDVQPAAVSLRKGSEIRQLELSVTGSTPPVNSKRKKNNQNAQVTETAPADMMVEENVPKAKAKARPNKKDRPQNPADPAK